MEITIKKVLFSGILATALSFTSCDNNGTADNDNTDDKYTTFVTRIENDTDKWDTDTAYWTGVETEYEGMRADMDAEYEKADENRRKEIDNIRMRYDKVKSDYMAAREQRMADANRLSSENDLRTKVFGAEATADLSNVNGKNIRSYYEKLVTNVKQNRESYTPAEWDAIKAWYEKLDALKNQFEGKDLSTEDNLAIAKLKVEYDAIAKVARLDSKIEQKVDEQTENTEPGKN